MAKKEPRIIPHDAKDDMTDYDLQTAELEAAAEQIVNNLNANRGLEKALTYLLDDTKDEETIKVLVKLKIERTDEVADRMLDLIGRQDPFITEKEAKLNGAANKMLAALKAADAIIKTARQYFPKSLHNSDKFSLELACAEIGEAIHQAEVK